MKSSRMLAIGELAKLFDLAPHVLRHWEDMGLLTPVRSGNGRRVYGPAEARRVALILLAKDAGLSLEQARHLFAATTDREARRAVYRVHRERLTERIAAARTALTIIEHAARCEAEDVTTCPHLNAKVAARLPAALRADG